MCRAISPDNDLSVARDTPPVETGARGRTCVGDVVAHTGNPVDEESLVPLIAEVGGSVRHCEIAQRETVLMLKFLILLFAQP